MTTRPAEQTEKYVSTDSSAMKNRRQFLKLTGLGVAAASAGACASRPAMTEPPTLGVSAASYMIRWRASRRKDVPPGVPVFRGPEHFIEHCHELGASCVQISVRDWDRDGRVHRVREAAESHGVALEGQISLPKKREDLDEFVNQLKTAREAGVRIVRSVCLGGRRYETFNSLAEWKAFVRHSSERLGWVEPILRKLGMQLALENHKDWRTEEMLGLLRRIDSEHVGANLDTGNNIALLDDGMETVAALAPYAISTHLKDMAVEEYEDGFRLAEVPLGEGMLDIRKIIRLCQRANPRVRFNLEMITRDPLEIPCLTERYWRTWAEPSQPALERTLATVRRHARPQPLPRVSHLSLREQVEAEEANNQQSFVWFWSQFA